MSRSEIETDRMIAAVNDNHREACHREQLADYERQLDDAHRQAARTAYDARQQAARTAYDARVAAQHQKLNGALVLAVGSRCAIGAVEAGLVHIWLGFGVAAAGLGGVIWLAGGLWQEFKSERR